MLVDGQRRRPVAERAMSVRQRIERAFAQLRQWARINTRMGGTLWACPTRDRWQYRCLSRLDYREQRTRPRRIHEHYSSSHDRDISGRTLSGFIYSGSRMSGSRMNNVCYANNNNCERKHIN